MARHLLVQLDGEQIHTVEEVVSEDRIPDLVLSISGGRTDYMLRPVKLSRPVPTVTSVKSVFWINEDQVLVPTNYLLLCME